MYALYENNSEIATGNNLNVTYKEISHADIPDRLLMSRSFGFLQDLEVVFDKSIELLIITCP